jgi:branched-chain amino acid aminotransferase
MSEIVYLNGQWVPRTEAAVSVYDGGFLHGAGLFETMRAENGRIFRLEAHLARLMRSAGKLLLPIEPSGLPSADDFQDLLRRNDLKRARVRLTVTSGAVLTAAESDRPRLTVCATASGETGYPEDLYQTGVTVMISRFRQSPSDPLAGHKTTNYLPRLIALRAAQSQRCVEALWFTTENLLAEGSISNVFVVKDGTVSTPRLETPVLPGITRAAILELCQAASIPAEERAVTVNDLLDADEVFITNSAMQVMPVCRVERADIADGRPGPITRRLLADYLALVTKECQLDGSD